MNIVYLGKKIYAILADKVAYKTIKYAIKTKNLASVFVNTYYYAYNVLKIINKFYKSNFSTILNNFTLWLNDLTNYHIY